MVQPSPTESNRVQPLYHWMFVVLSCLEMCWKCFKIDIVFLCICYCCSWYLLVSLGHVTISVSTVSTAWNLGLPQSCRRTNRAGRRGQEGFVPWWRQRGRRGRLPWLSTVGSQGADDEATQLLEEISQRNLSQNSNESQKNTDHDEIIDRSWSATRHFFLLRYFEWSPPWQMILS